MRNSAASHLVAHRLGRRTVLAACLSAALPLGGTLRHAAAAATDIIPVTVPITSCADSGAGTLRSKVSTVGSGTVLDMSGLACSTISLTTGALIIPHEISSLTLKGPTDHALAITGNDAGRVFVHNGEGTLTVYRLTITHGAYTSGDYGGACIYAFGSVALVKSMVSNCTLNLTGGPFTNGGGIYAHGDLTLTDSVLSGNQAIVSSGFTNGGGASIGGNLTCTRSTIRDNTAAGPHGHSQDGGVFARGAMQLDSCTVSGNQSEYIGALQAIGNVTCTNSTVSGNSASVRIGGVLAQESVTLDHCTIAFNTHFNKQFGAGIYASGSVLIANSSIIAGNTSTQNGAAYDLGRSSTSIFTGSHNLITACNRSVPADTISADPQLAPLADNGGPTRTHAPLPGSPAVDTGDNIHGLAFDQRGVGYPRVAGAAADIGSFESSDRIFGSGFE